MLVSRSCPSRHPDAAAAPHHRIQVTFEDTGVGIAPENLEHIFDLYFTTKEHGSGIGLAMVYRTIQLHDGDIEVESVLGKGTTFRVTLRQSPLDFGTLNLGLRT